MRKTLQRNADSFYSLNGADLKSLFRILSTMSKRILNGGFHFRFINICISPEIMARFHIIIFLVMITCSVPRTGLSQPYHTTLNKALNAYKEGVKSFDYIDFLSAERYFKQAIEIDKGFFEAYMMLGELLSKQKRYAEAAHNYPNGCTYRFNRLYACLF